MHKNDLEWELEDDDNTDGDGGSDISDSRKWSQARTCGLCNAPEWRGSAEEVMMMVVMIFQTPESEVKPGPAIQAPEWPGVSNGGYDDNTDDDGGDDISDSRRWSRARTCCPCTRTGWGSEERWLVQTQQQVATQPPLSGDVTDAKVQLQPTMGECQALDSLCNRQDSLWDTVTTHRGQCRALDSLCNRQDSLWGTESNSNSRLFCEVEKKKKGWPPPHPPHPPENPHKREVGMQVVSRFGPAVRR